MDATKVKIPPAILKHCALRDIEVEVSVDCFQEVEFFFNKGDKSYWAPIYFTEGQILSGLLFRFG